MAFRPATRQRAKLRLALAGLSGSGKSYTSLLIASILAELMRATLGRRGRIALIDTEHESADLYSMTEAQKEQHAALSGQDAITFVTNANAFLFDTQPLDNHSPRAYVELLSEARDAGYDICIIDSLSHAWTGKNGALEQKDSIAARSGNSYTAWRDITPMHNQLVDAMLSSPMHIFATMRQKMDYIQTKGADGKTVIEKVGLEAVQREGMEYEFTIFGDLDKGNTMRIAKHRLPGVLSMGDVFERPGETFTRRLFNWLMSGAEPAAIPIGHRDQAPMQTQAAAQPTLDQRIVDAIHTISQAGSLEELEALVPRMVELARTHGSVMGEARARYNERKAKLTAELVERQRTAASAPPAETVSDIGHDRMSGLLDTIATAPTFMDLQGLIPELRKYLNHPEVAAAYKARLEYFEHQSVPAAPAPEAA